MHSKRSMQGFTLIEIMIVVVIIGIIASIAYPSYTEYVNRANRAEGQAGLLDLAARQERYFAQNNKYATTFQQLGLGSGTEKATETRKYNLKIVSADATKFKLSATPTFSDNKCSGLEIESDGKKSGSGNDQSACWR